MTDHLQPPRPSWRRRWLVVRTILGFCAAITIYVTLFGPDDRVRETALLGALSLAGAVALGYLGFATQDDGHWLRLAARDPKP